MPREIAFDEKRKNRIAVECRLPYEREPAVNVELLKKQLGLVDFFWDEHGEVLHNVGNQSCWVRNCLSQERKSLTNLFKPVSSLQAE